MNFVELFASPVPAQQVKPAVEASKLAVQAPAHPGFTPDASQYQEKPTFTEKARSSPVKAKSPSPVPAKAPAKSPSPVQQTSAKSPSPVQQAKSPSPVPAKIPAKSPSPAQEKTETVERKQDSPKEMLRKKTPSPDKAPKVQVDTEGKY